MKRLSSVVAAMALSFGFVAAATGQDKPDGGDTLIRIQEYPGGTGGVPAWVAIEKGFCKKYNIRCAMVSLGSGPLGLQTLAAGSIEASYASNEVNVMAASRGNEILLVVGHTPNSFYTVNVRSDYPLPNLAKGYPEAMKDLKGSKIGVTARGAGTEIVARALLQGSGMSDKDVTFVAVGSTATSYPAMLAKQIDAIVSFEPFNTVCLAQKTCVVLLSPGKGEGPADLLAMNGAFNSYAMSKKFVQSNPKAADAFVAAIRDATAWAKDPGNFDELLTIARKRISLGDIPDSDKVFVQLIRREVETWGPTIARASIDATSNFLMKNKLSEKPVSSATLVYEKAPRP